MAWEPARFITSNPWVFWDSLAQPRCRGTRWNGRPIRRWWARQADSHGRACTVWGSWGRLRPGEFCCKSLMVSRELPSLEKLCDLGMYTNQWCCWIIYDLNRPWTSVLRCKDWWFCMALVVVGQNPAAKAKASSGATRLGSLPFLMHPCVQAECSGLILLISYHQYCQKGLPATW